MDLLVSPTWLAEHAADEAVRIVDTRFTLGKPDAGANAYLAGHIPGAVFVDLERDLSGPVRADRVGGRHPMPPVADLERALSALGISNGHHVVAYDDPSTGGGFYAAHFWWLLRYLGHDRVSVLNGGLPAWLAAGGLLETAVPSKNSGHFVAAPRPEMVVDATYVAGRPDGTVLLDSRAPERYRGDVEPLDWKAGHIPGAWNRNWADGVSGGRYLDGEAQRARFADVAGAEEIVVYCGSGVSAGGNLLALELAGISGAKLYAGSWSDWVSNLDHPIANGELPG